MSNIQEFRKLVKSLPESHQVRLPEKIRELTNRPEHTAFLKATEGNAKRPLLQLIALAKMRPDGIWDGD